MGDLKIPPHVARYKIPRIDSKGSSLLCRQDPVPDIGKMYRNHLPSGDWNCGLGRYATARNALRTTELPEDPLREVHDHGGSTFEPTREEAYIL
jgi:hypothetical protein